MVCIKSKKKSNDCILCFCSRLLILERGCFPFQEILGFRVAIWIHPILADSSLKCGNIQVDESVSGSQLLTKSAHRIERILIVLQQIRTLGQELSQQPIGVLARSHFARNYCAQITEVHPSMFMALANPQ